MRKKFLCVDCAHKHRFELPEKQGIALRDYVLIDGEKWVNYHRPPSRKVKCNECRKKTRYVFEVMK